MQPNENNKKMEQEKEQKLRLEPGDAEQCIAVLEFLLDNSEQLVQLNKEQRIRLMKAAGQLTRPDRAEQKKRNKGARQVKKQEQSGINRKARAASSIRTARLASVFEAPEQLALG